MRKPATSHQRNYVILGKAGHPIDQKTFFRDRFFRNATWKTMPMHTGNVKEEAIIPFEVVVRGQSIGSYPIRVDHAPNRIANQNNSPTYLNWSSLLDEITRTNYTNYYLLLERLSSGAFRLSLTPTQPQPAMIP